MKTLKIIPDMDPMSPREWDNVGTMACWHRRYHLGDEQPKDDPQEWLRQLAAEHVGADDAELIPDKHIERILAKHFLIRTLYLYDHSGITISMGGFYDPWDSGPVGYIYCSLAKARKDQVLPETAGWDTLVGWTKPDGTPGTLLEVTLHNFECEVEIYARYLENDVWGFVLEDEEGEELDSCWGFYGSDPEENGMLGNIALEDQEELEILEGHYETRQVLVFGSR